MGILLLIGGLWMAWHVVSLAVWPTRPCSLCHGAKVHHGWPRKAFRPCLKCGGGGSQPRMGIRIFRKVKPKGPRW